MCYKLFLSILTTLTLSSCGSSLFESNGITAKQRPSRSNQGQTLNPQSPDQKPSETTDCSPHPPAEAVLGMDEDVLFVIEKSCSSGGCHNNSDVIDLTNFPFDYQGSYTEQAIQAELGQSAEVPISSIEAQKIVVQELISAIETQYMPPPSGSAPIPSGEDIQTIIDWLDRGLLKSKD